MTAPRRSLDLPDVHSVLADARSLHETGYDLAGRWDLTQVCLHLTKAMRSSIEGFEVSAPGLIRWLIKWIGLKNRTFRTRRLWKGLPAPKPFVFEPAKGNRETEAQAVDALAQATEAFVQAEGNYAPHPAFGPLTRDQWAQFHCIHGAHHLSFLIPKSK